MLHNHIFGKKPGSGLDEKMTIRCNELFHFSVRPQLLFIKDNFFTNHQKSRGKEEFETFLTLPLISGYVLGITGGFLAHDQVILSELDKRNMIIYLEGLYENNGFSLGICSSFAMQQEIFKFGLDIGKKDWLQYRSAIKSGEKVKYVLLAAICTIFLRFGDKSTIKLNVGIFARLHGIALPPDAAIDSNSEWVLDFCTQTMNP